MNFFQQTLKLFYPVRMFFSRITGLGVNVYSNKMQQPPVIPFYSLEAYSISNQLVSFEQFRNKQILICNLASNCGFTGQYSDLEDLYETYQDRLIILGFPSNDFGRQEPGSDAEIAEFCKLNYGISFPLFKKEHVSGPDKQAVYQWLTDPAKNGWNQQEPGWNFFKYLINDKGELTHFFTSAVSPLDKAITDLLE